MDYGICIISLVPCREEANDKSQMVTQLLFGDLVKIIGQNESWYKVQIVRDNYKTWVDKKQLKLIDSNIFSQLSNSVYIHTEELVTPIQNTESKMVQVLAMGSTIYNYNKEEKRFRIGELSFTMNGNVRATEKKINRNQLVEDAFSYLNCPYLWGGKSPFGIDCSGFTQMVYSMNGKDLPRDAWQQAELGRPLSFIEEAKQGDLAFFDNNEGKINHVGIMLNDNKIIHASGQVRIDRIDHQGIFRNDTNDYSHSLRIIKRMI